ncbi:probable 3-hydroxyisobutyrate dehydrogenase, mitochondrial [Arthrobacter sp. Hiyo8]|nr:probable 3-hydroxyisobutyrate dehydrogenase, mitochondrial [Arthrobacter sp. Hiyo8]
MSNVAVIGLGIMGLPMAINLVKAGHSVTGFNRSQDKIDKLVSEGGKGATSIADAVKDADVVITMVPDSPDVEGVVSGPDGVFANAKKGTLWIDASSIRPDVAARLSADAVAAGIRPLDARFQVANRVPSTPSSPSWSAATQTTSKQHRMSSTPSARPSSTSAPPAPARPSRQPIS